MKVLKLAVFVLLVQIPLAAAWADETAPTAELRSTTQAMLDAIAPGERSVWEENLHPDFTRLDENGDAMAGPAFLEEIQPLPAGLEGRMEIEGFSVSVSGDTAVATYKIQEYLSYFGQPLRSRFRSMDIWIRTADGWRLFGQHVAAELKDPPSVAVSSDTLCAYEGVYELTREIRTTIECAPEGLRSTRTGRPAATFLAETERVFFVPGRPRTRRIFLLDEGGDVIGFVDRREGEDVRWRRVNGSNVD